MPFFHFQAKLVSPKLYQPNLEFRKGMLGALVYAHTVIFYRAFNWYPNGTSWVIERWSFEIKGLFPSDPDSVNLILFI